MISRADLFLLSSLCGFFEHGIKLILLVDDLTTSITSEALSLLLQVLSELSLIWNLTAKEVSSLLLRVEVTPLRVLIFFFIKGGKVLRCTSPVVLLVSLIILALVSLVIPIVVAVSTIVL